MRQFFNYFFATDLYESFHRRKRFTYDAAALPEVDEKEETTDYADYVDFFIFLLSSVKSV